MIIFKKIDSDCYLVSDGFHAVNMFVTKSRKLIFADIYQFFFECSSMKELENKVALNWNDMDKFEI
jgi:hypothetical protein